MAVTNKQAGSFLIEFILVAAIVLILAVWGSGELVAKAKNLQAQALANWMKIGQNGVQNYLNKNYSNVVELIQTHGSADFNQVLKPSWQDLKQANLLNQAWGITGPAKLKLDYKIYLVGDCTEQNCRLQALVHTDQPVLGKDGQADMSFIANWLLAANGHGLVYKVKNSIGSFKAAGLNLLVPDTFANGVLAMLAEKNLFADGDNEPDPNSVLDPDTTPDPSPEINTDEFLRVQDTRNPDFQGDATVQGIIRSESYVHTAQGLIVEASNQINQTCTHENEITVNSSFPGLLICKSGVRLLAAPPRAGGYMINTKKGCKNIMGQSTANPVTGQCSCPIGHVQIQIAESGALTDFNGLNMGYICLLK